MFRRARGGPLALLIVLALLAAACSGGTNPTTTTSAEGVTTTTGGGSGETTTTVSTPPDPAGTLEMVDARVEGSAPADLDDEAAFAITVKLKEGITWSDGTPFTAHDFAGSYEIRWGRQAGVWNSLTSVTATDDHTLVFQTKTLSANLLRDLIRWNQTTSTSQYGDFFERFRQLRESGADPAGEEVTALVDELLAYSPSETVAYGPFVVDPASVTTQQLKMKKNAGGYNADVIGFEEVIVHWGSTQQTMPLILGNQLDYSTDPLSPADEQAVAGKDNVTLIRTPLQIATGIWFNQSIEPFNLTEFRQAVALIVDRERNATVSLGSSARAIEYMSGYSDNLARTWLDDATRNSLNKYEHDLAAATALLEGAGFTKSGDSWSDPSGAPVKFEITAPTDFTDFLASARDVSEQLNDFGFDTTVRGIPAANRLEVIPNADYQVMLDFSMISTPNHPHSSLNWNMGFGFWGNNNPEAPEGTSRGMNYPWDQVDLDGNEVYIPDLLAASIAGLDLGPQADAVATLTQIFNRDLPVVPLYERYTNDPSMSEPRVRGWLPQDHPVYMNNQGSDNYASIQLLQGTLQPIDGADGTFQTAAQYVQPPGVSWSFYTADSMYQSLTSPAYDVSFPPLFWYSESEQVYFSSVAESYSIYEIPGR